MIKGKQRNDLIKYRIKQAKTTKNQAKLMIDNEMFRGAINRIYYGIQIPGQIPIPGSPYLII